jgi:hypothetical protein
MTNKHIVRAKPPQLVRKRIQVVLPKNVSVVIKPSRAQVVNLKDLRKQVPQPAKPIPQPKVEPAQPQNLAMPAAAIARQKLIKSRRSQQGRKKTEVKYVSRDINPESINRIALLRNAGRGKLLIIVGNGPSILEADLGRLRNNPRIQILTVNKPDARLWPTDFWAFFDSSQFRRHEELWNGYSGLIFNSTAIKRQKSTSMQFRNKGGKGWSRDLLSGIHIGRSSVYASMQIASWMNHEHVYIFGCLPDGEKILTGRGMVAIDALGPLDQVYTTQGFKQLTGYQRRWYEGTLVSLTTRMNNIPLNVTEEHPILVERQGQESFVRAGDIGVGDIAIYPIDQSVEEDRHSTDFWWLVGVYAAQGYIRPVRDKYKYAVMCLGRHEASFQQKVAKTAALCLGCRTTGDKRNRSTTELVINNDYFGRFVAEHVGRGSTTKFLSPTVMRLPPDKQAAFVAGYCEGDGSLFVKNKLGKHECTFSTASESLAECLQKLLLRFGVISSLVKSKRPSGFDRSGCGQYGVRYHVHVIGAVLDSLASRCGWTVTTSKKRPLFDTEILDGRLRVRVRSVSHTSYVGYVNNIEVKGPHTYSSRLLMTHNCDMNPDGINGKLHFYGQNPDVDQEQRKQRFAKEAVFYDQAADIMTPDERLKFTFCSAYNKWPFVEKYGRLDHREAIDHILKHAEQLNKS